VGQPTSNSALTKFVKDSSFQAAVKMRGESIFNQVDEGGPSLFSKNYWYGEIMDWSMKNESFKTQMFRFVDVLPYLNSGSEVARHLKEYFAEGGEELPKVFNVGLGLGSLAPGLMAGAIKKNVTSMAKMFITGETPQEALSVLKKSRKMKVGFTVDILGEASLSAVESQDYQNKYLELVGWLAKDATTWDPVPQIDEDHRGPIPRVNVSVKLSSLDSEIDLKAWEKSKARMKDRVRPIFRKAMEAGVFITIDMEQYELKDFTIEVFKELLSETEFANYPHWGCVIQAYLRDSSQDIRKLIEFSKARGVPFTVRLVKGAYWDFETVFAQQAGWPVPVYTIKKESDANFELCATMLLEAHESIRLAIGSHNVRSIASAIVAAERLGVDPRSFEIQMLYGMADGFKRSLVKQGFRVREYAPVGELIPGMAYLVRRLLENTSNESFLRSKFSDGASTENLLKDPSEGLVPSTSNPYDLEPTVTPKLNAAKTVPKFRNLPLIDFAIEENRAKLRTAFAKLEKTLGQEWPSYIGGKEIRTGRLLESVNPSNPAQVIGKVHLCGASEAEQALTAAQSAFKTWQYVAPSERARLVDKLADILERDRLDWTALEVFEAGKPWDEADGDLAEAVDFCRYYARDMRRLANGQKVGGVPGETSIYHHKARGVVAVIASWNFPLAIICGMVAAATVTGNTVVMKPAEQTGVIGAWLMRAIREAGFPDGVVNLVQGLGEEIGDTLTGSPITAMIAFTGSKAVGLHILKQAAIVHPGQRHMKRVMAELGGKNAIIIDTDADLDEAIGGVLYSAFGFSGQKCSAAGRVIVLDEIYDRFIGRLLEAAKAVKVQMAQEPDVFVGPVIDHEAQSRILQMIENAKKESKLAFQGGLPETAAGAQPGYFVPPTIFTDVNPESELGQNEVFGPVLAVLRVKNMIEAIEVANNVEYGLTGGIYSRSPANIELAKQRLEVGNLYINRGCTGAMVDRHPFGGFKMSGVGSKTGGPEYLQQFMEPRVITENTLRRGFAPAE
jgi:RHH-type transcriptional regulator, proline utilization regulon repressor / proline dehydrogenase / delta 1-pyrroline-5-carboxylate dehydrogenase